MSLNNNDYMKQYRLKNKEKINEIMRRYVNKNKERFTEYNRNYAKNKYDTNEDYRQYMISKSLNKYNLSKNPYIAECKRLMKILI